MAQAFIVASKSPDPRTQIGALIDPVSVFCCPPQACNYFPYQPDELTWDEMLASPEKYNWVEHAERAAVYESARLGVCLVGATMYCTLAACLACARAIQLSGIRRVFSHQALYDLCPPRWKEEVDEAIKQFGKVGIEYVLVNDKLVAPTIRFDAKMFDPATLLVSS